LRGLGAAAFWLSVWWAAAALVRQELVLPSPRDVAEALASLAATGDFWLTVGHTLLHIACGFLAGAAAGALLALGIFFSPC
jgi:NitT/TauT family transport system permease protein